MATTTTQTTLQYLEQVETFFLAHRGRGLMVSPADAQFLGELEARGVPAEIVCRGLARAFATRTGRPGAADGAPRSVRACESFIETEVTAWRAREVGRNPWSAPATVAGEPSAVERLAGLLASIERHGRVAEDPARAYYRRAWRHVRDLAAQLDRDPSRAGAVMGALADIESRLLSDLCAQLAPIEQVMIRRRAEARVRLDPRSASPRALADGARVALEAELRSTYGLLSLTGQEP